MGRTSILIATIFTGSTDLVSIGCNTKDVCMQTFQFHPACLQDTEVSTQWTCTCTTSACSESNDRVCLGSAVCLHLHAVRATTGCV